MPSLTVYRASLCEVQDCCDDLFTDRFNISRVDISSTYSRGGCTSVITHGLIREHTTYASMQYGKYYVCDLIVAGGFGGHLLRSLCLNDEYDSLYIAFGKCRDPTILNLTFEFVQHELIRHSN